MITWEKEEPALIGSPAKQLCGADTELPAVRHAGELFLTVVGVSRISRVTAGQGPSGCSVLGAGASVHELPGKASISLRMTVLASPPRTVLTTFCLLEAS